ncbi:uncharacterized protein LOC143856228 [Tasmannia lanceolata]|uniref:uncharacterized protein LOC143856228 n=1 Tax=Tasmannia lanceolata TaxID=3420 RepID=UPI004063E293
MDKLFEQYNKESMKKMMLKHEDIFKEQVRELHQLYKVQKILMAKMRSRELKLPSIDNDLPRAIHVGSDYIESDNQTRFWSTGTGSQSSHSPFRVSHHLTTEMDYNIHKRYNVRVDQSSQEPSSYSGDAFRVQMENISCTDASAIEDQASFIRTLKDKMRGDGPQDPHFYTDEDSEIELTLGIGHGTEKKKRNRHPCSDLQLGSSESKSRLIPSTLVRPDHEEECSDTLSATFNRETLQRPHWLFRALCLNRR